MKKREQITEPPAGFGSDEINRQLKRNSEPFQVWWDRNFPQQWWVMLCNTDRKVIGQLLEAAYNRKDVKIL